MKGVRFRNSSCLIQQILAATPTPHPQDLSLDLEFSTFRSEDYRYQDYLPHQMASPLLDDSDYSLDYFTNSLRSEDSEQNEGENCPNL